MLQWNRGGGGREGWHSPSREMCRLLEGVQGGLRLLVGLQSSDRKNPPYTYAVHKLAVGGLASGLLMRYLVNAQFQCVLLSNKYVFIAFGDSPKDMVASFGSQLYQAAPRWTFGSPCTERFMGMVGGCSI